MGSGRIPTERQKQRIRAAGLRPRDYLVLWEYGGRMALVYRGTGRTRVIVTEKEPTGGRRSGSGT